MKKVLLFLAVFSFGYMCNDLTEKINVGFVKPAYADVPTFAGLDYLHLINNKLFVDAVKIIVNRNCKVFDFKWVDGSTRPMFTCYPNKEQIEILSK